MDYDKRSQYEMEMEAVRANPQKPTELTKAQCLDAITHMEMAKFDV